MADFELFARRIMLFLATLAISGSSALFLFSLFNLPRLEGGSWVMVCALVMMLVSYFWLDLEFEGMGVAEAR